MILPNVRLDEFYHIIKKKSILGKKQVIRTCGRDPPPFTPKSHIRADRSILPENAIMTLCILRSHKNKENKKKIAKIA